MDQNLESRLAGLPPLSRANAVSAAIPCKICQRAAMFFDVVDFQKCVGNYVFGPSRILVDWFRCQHCDFLFTPFFDDWTDADFARFIYNVDYVKVDPDYVSVRPYAVARNLAEVLKGHESARILDYGAGQGLFARGMAGLGFHHVESYDPFSIPSRPVGEFDVITCNEVIEHTLSPTRVIDDMRSMLRPGGCILIGEVLHPPDIGRLRGNWWYIAPRNGHVSTFSDRTFAVIAERLRMAFHRGPGTLHAMCNQADSEFSVIANRCGPSMTALRLCAPSRGPASGWGGLEDTPPWQFRFTTAEAVHWSIDIPEWKPRLVQVIIPIAHESRQGFAAQCVVEVSGQKANTRLQDRAIVAETGPLDAGAAVLTLRTPALLAASDRAIGLAIMTA